MSKKKVLIVDDDDLILNMLREVLEEEGYTPSLSSNGEDALNKLGDEEFGLVISDVRMPGMDGFELLEKIKSNNKEIKVIMMTGYTEDYDISDALILGADDYITKPFDIPKVLLAVKNVLQD